MDFYETYMGRKFYDGTMPQIVEELGDLTRELRNLKNELARMNDLKEQELLSSKSKELELEEYEL